MVRSGSRPSQKLRVSLVFVTSERRPAQQLHSQLTAAGSRCADDMPLWNALLRHYSLGVFPQESLFLFKFLQSFSPSLSFDSFTYSFLLKACTNLRYAVGRVQLHALTFKAGFESHVYVQTALVDAYCTSGSLLEAQIVFDGMPHRNPVSWNVLITGLIKWGELSLARSLFTRMPTRTVVSWTGVIDGYARNHQPREALSLFGTMVGHEGVRPTQVTMLAIFPAISGLGALPICQSIHAYAEKKGFTTRDIRIMNSLIDAYAKCGCIWSASRVFEEIVADVRNLVSWTSIISGFAMHGRAKDALENFERMAKACLRPNRITFLSILHACSHGGLVEEGLGFFRKMTNEYQIIPDIKHYGCLIDMLGRAGRLDEAERIASEIPAEIANVVIWRTILGACSFHGYIEMGERVTEKIMEMERAHGGDYVLMSNIFSGSGRFDDATRVRRLMDKSNASKVQGLSLV
ncbi:pentatricopeptide repeat-containing protein At1g09220, mitochondrial [Malania oleifera]|uniref:pentatricopeptide repeat-containing protein At1g09220, mitochondrial n=1 Tax=Malania oleifera TaxID=397392 RepID=UPI0025AE5F84|nr:pentatricopeptide repeat-containing protein At1g09220, mitochondrial [Malania oleifera]